MRGEIDGETWTPAIAGLSKGHAEAAVGAVPRSAVLLCRLGRAAAARVVALNARWRGPHQRAL